jgi:hypothetical protein
MNNYSCQQLSIRRADRPTLNTLLTDPEVVARICFALIWGKPLRTRRFVS